MIAALLNINVSVKRRADQGRDVLGNPTYGTPTSGAGWSIVYTAMPARLAFNRKQLAFAATGERVIPSGTLYFPAEYAVKVEDRILTPDNIEYVIVGVVPGYVVQDVVDHYEAQLALP